MKTIEEHIEYLLREHDCVILPGWGAFIAQCQNARIEGGCIQPPKRSYGFNGALTFSDGLLENSIVRRTRCSYATASEQVREAVAALKHQIDAAGEVAVGRIGLFSRNTDGALLFTPFERQALASQFYGFTAFSFTDFQQQVTDDSDTQQQDEAQIVELPAWQRFGRKYMQIAASIIVLLMMIFVLSTPLTVSHSGSDFAGINDSFTLHHRSNNVTIADTGARRELAVMLPQTALKDVTSTDSQLIDSSESTLFKEGDYCLVVASGRSMNEAEKFSEYHKSAGVDFRIFEVNGKFRVYVATGETYAELMNVQDSLREHFPESWICKR